MAETLTSDQEFSRTLAEVEFLLGEADAASPDQPHANEMKFGVMNKAALLLLTGKFESFLESTAEDFLFAINGVGARGCHVPARILAEHSVRAVRDAERRLSNGDLEGIRTVFMSLGRHWTDVDPCSDLDVSCKFNYGKHGEEEMVKLFRRIGIDDVFARVTIADDASETYEGAIVPAMDVKGLVNSLTAIRNNILHQDQSPNLTAASLRKQCGALRRFSTALVAALQAIVDEVERNVRAEGVGNAH